MPCSTSLSLPPSLSLSLHPSMFSAGIMEQEWLGYFLSAPALMNKPFHMLSNSKTTTRGAACYHIKWHTHTLTQTGSCSPVWLDWLQFFLISCQWWLNWLRFWFWSRFTSQMQQQQQRHRERLQEITVKVNKHLQTSSTENMIQCSLFCSRRSQGRAGVFWKMKKLHSHTHIHTDRPYAASAAQLHTWTPGAAMWEVTALSETAVVKLKRSILKNICSETTGKAAAFTDTSTRTRCFMLKRFSFLFSPVEVVHS